MLNFILTEKLRDDLDILRCKINDFWHGLLCRFWYKYNVINIKTLDPDQWYNKDTLMLHANFKLLTDFMEKEKPDKTIDWNDTSESKQAWGEIKALYRWWTIERPLRLLGDPLNVIEDLEFVWGVASRDSDGRVLTYSLDDIQIRGKEHSSEEANEIIQKSLTWEKESYQEDTDMLIRLMKIREYLWT